MYDTNLVHANKQINTEMLESVKTVKTGAIMIYVILSDFDVNLSKSNHSVLTM